MSEDSREQLRAAIAAAQAREDERQEQGRRLAQAQAERVRRAAEAEGPLTDVLQTFLQVMAQHGNPGLQEVMLSSYYGHENDGGPRYRDVPAGKRGWQISGGGRMSDSPLWVCPDGSGVGGRPSSYGTTTQVVPL